MVGCLVVAHYSTISCFTNILYCVQLDHSCVGKIEEYAKAVVNDQVHTFGPFFPAGDKIFFAIEKLTRSQHYNVSVWIENIDGKSNAIEMALSRCTVSDKQTIVSWVLSCLSFSCTGTFAVQGVNYSVDSQGVCIECLFSSGLSSSGCFVMVSAADGQGNVMVHIYRDNDALSAIGCIGNLATGVYKFTVYDLLDNGQAQNIVAFEKDKVTIVTSPDVVTSTIATTTKEPITTRECDSFEFQDVVINKYFCS